MRDEKNDGSCSSSNRGFRKRQTSSNGVKSIMKRGKIIINYTIT